MIHRVVLSLVLSLPGSSFLVACSPAHDHAHPPSGPAELEPSTVTVFGERALLFMEFPPLVKGEPARFLVHLSVNATGEPVRSGRVALDIGGFGLAVDAPKREGLFVPEGAPPTAGVQRARVIVTSEQVEETLDLGEITVYETAEAARRAAESATPAETPNAVPFLLEQQWKVKLLLSEARPRSLSNRLVVPAQAKVPEGALASVAVPAAGRLVAPHSAKRPRTGDRVDAGQILGLVEPPLGASDVAQLQALSLDFDLKVLEVTRVSGEAVARLNFAERERKRIADLRAEGLSTQQQIEQAEQNLSVARSDAEVARATKESLDRLIKGRDVPADSRGLSSVRLPMRAPIAGTIVVVHHVEGESVAADAEVFRILDASRLWIEGRVSEFDLPRVKSAPAAFVSFPALPTERFELSPAAVAGAYISPVIDSASRTFSIRYELENPTGALKDGMLAQLALVTASVESAVAIPVEAVIVEQGIPTAYVMLEGETFQKRDLELGVRDGGFVEVLRGIAAGERVATRGAYIVKLAALSPASFGAGHAH